MKTILSFAFLMLAFSTFGQGAIHSYPNVPSPGSGDLFLSENAAHTQYQNTTWAQILAAMAATPSNGSNVTNAFNAYVVGAQSGSFGFNRLTHLWSKLQDGTTPPIYLTFTDQGSYPGDGKWVAGWDGVLGRNGGLFPRGGSEGDYQEDLNAGTLRVQDLTTWVRSGGLLNLFSTNVATWHRRSTGTATNFFMDTCKILYVIEPGAGTFLVQTNINGGGWTTVNTISCNGTLAGGVTNYTWPVGNYSVRVSGATGKTRVDSGILYYSTTNAAVHGQISIGSLSLSDLTNCPRAVTDPWLTAMNPTLVMVMDTDVARTPPYYPNVEAIWNADTTNADIIYSGNHRVVGASQPILLAQNIQTRTNALLYGRAFFDLDYEIGTNTDEQLTLNIIQGAGDGDADSIHLKTPKGTDLANARLWNQVKYNMIQGNHVDPLFNGDEVHLLNSAKTNLLGIGTTTPVGRLSIYDPSFGGANDILSFGSLFNGTVAIGRGATFDFNNALVYGSSANTVINSPSAGTLFFEQTQNTPMGQFMPSKGLAVSTSFSPVDPGAGGISAAANIISAVGFVGNLNTATNIGGTFLQTNWISGQVYTNDQKSDIWVQCSVSMATASVAGACRVSLQSGVNIAGLAHLSGVGGQTIVGSLAETETNWLGGFVASGNVFTFTNNVTGVGNSALIISGTGQRKTF